MLRVRGGGPGTIDNSDEDFEDQTTPANSQAKNSFKNRTRKRLRGGGSDTIEKGDSDEDFVKTTPANLQAKKGKRKKKKLAGETSLQVIFTLPQSSMCWFLISTVKCCILYHVLIYICPSVHL